MTNKERVSKAQDIVLEETSVDYIVDTRTTPDFVEVTGNAGGDVVTYRVHNNGTITER